MALWVAAILGIVEGLTEYLPVSSTAHIEIAGKLLGVADEPGFASFDVFIQIGAIFAVLVYYRKLLWARLQGLFDRDPKAIQLFSGLIVGFLPAAVIGFIANKWIKSHLFNLTVICVAFVVGGIIMIVVEVWKHRPENHGLDGLEHVTVHRALLIGIGQVFAMVPGVSRSMATIVSGQLAGLSTATSAEFSFLLGLITLSAASVFTGVKERHELMHAGLPAIVVGVLVSFVVAWVVIAAFIRYLQRRGLSPFGYYRIAAAVLIWLTLVR